MADKNLKEELLVYFDHNLAGAAEDRTFEKPEMTGELSCNDDDLSTALEELIREGYIQAEEKGDEILVTEITEKGFEKLEEIGADEV